MTDLPNRYGSACDHAARTARDTVDDLTATGGHPLAGPLTTLQDAWVSPSTQRLDVQTTLDALSRSVVSAFDALATDLAHTAAREPDTVDTDDPTQAWKARFDSRPADHPRVW